MNNRITAKTVQVINFDGAVYGNVYDNDSRTGQDVVQCSDIHRIL